MGNQWRGKFLTLKEHRQAIPPGGLACDSLTRTKTGIRGIKPLKDRPTFGNFSAVLPHIIRQGNTRKPVKRITVHNARII